ncbi:FAD-dependent protein [Pelagicoccus sp. SDUM812003]|uniref:NAD(P)/FAD-dependent oxidoreductase n=1 Tax=Pelagicoccus sp. SDUM812003 TaxID=3041267 RepID=UPI00280C93DC|nr:FAD-binding protein [Pelagicoccus sp. SDUM812003]MDQ8205376.1 FAD-binding protein [Pelagicoccus sp. SDUM812003]
MKPVKILTVDIVLPLDQSENVEVWKKRASRKLRIHPNSIADIRLRKHSIDARQKPVRIQLRLELSQGGPLPEEPSLEPSYAQLDPAAKRIVIVGCGPAGMFAALRAIELGFKPVILERGKDAMARRFDLAPILRKGIVIEDSNYCFGEGGAGTFSDGKLYTRATKRGPVRSVYETLVAHGAPQQILTDAHPHIGSNLLPNVVRAIRESIIAAGGEVHFESRVEGLVRSADGRRIRGVVSRQGQEFLGEAVILATGHSARDIYRLLQAEGVLLEQKPFAVGVRIEHSQALIDSIQYHYDLGQERPRILPAAKYRLATKIEGRGVHSFCMCPGGFIVPSATENDEVVVNGMSLARRDSPFSNSGLVVTVEPEDTEAYRAEFGVLAGIAYQKELERLASRAGGGMQKAPAQRVTDFLKAKVSDSLPGSSYFPGLTSAALHELLPESVAWRMKEGLEGFGKSMRGYITEECNLIGFETRTSSPVRIPRLDTTLQHPELEKLYPCGEGAGFAGGIVSAALDGIRCAEAACAG